MPVCAVGAIAARVVAARATLAVGGRDLVPVLLRVAAVLAGGGGADLAIVVGRHRLVRAVALRREYASQF